MIEIFKRKTLFLNFENKMKRILILFSLLFLIGCSIQIENSVQNNNKEIIIEMVHKHAQAWISGDMELLDSLLHDDVVFAYPGRRLNKKQTLEDLNYFKDHFKDTKVYFKEIIVDGNNVAVEWQFATTKIETGERQVVSDAIIAKVKDGKFIVWKEYLDGRVKLLQASGELFYEEGEEPYPWPLKTDKYGLK